MDDMTGEALGYTMNQLLDKGALDVYHTPIYMKKSRPGVLLTTLAPQTHEAELINILLEETTTLGVRTYQANRTILERTIITVSTAYGKIRLKQAKKNGKVLRAMPEYEDVIQAAATYSVPYHTVYQAALNIGINQA